jgi:hypothetical protein
LIPREPQRQRLIGGKIMGYLRVERLLVSTVGSATM